MMLHFCLTSGLEGIKKYYVWEVVSLLYNDFIAERSMGLKRPRTFAELPNPFDKIGEPGWLENSVAILEAYDVPLPVPVKRDEIKKMERSIGTELPASYRQFLMELGPVDMDRFDFLSPKKITTLENSWFRERLCEDEQKALGHMIGVVDYFGEDEIIALDLETARCCYCDNFQNTFSNWLETFDDLLKIAFIKLPVSYYGWPDYVLGELIHDYQKQKFGTCL